jgi:hypothetical protein
VSDRQFEHCMDLDWGEEDRRERPKRTGKEGEDVRDLPALLGGHRF